MKPFSVLSAFLLCLSPQALYAQASTPTKVVLTQWSAEEVKNQQNEHVACVLRTTLSQPQMAAQFAFHFSKNDAFAPRASLVIPNSLTQERVFIKMNKKVSHPFLKMTTGENAEMQNLVYLPLDFPLLLKNLLQLKVLDLRTQSQNVQFVVQLTRVNKAVQQTLKCLNKKTLLNEAFFNDLNKAQTQNVIAANSPVLTEELLKNIDSAYAQYLKMTDLNQSLQKQKTLMAPAVAKVKKAQAVFDPLEKRWVSLNEQKNKQDSLLQEIVSKQTQAQQDLLIKTKELADAELNLKEKTDIYKPLLERMKPYQLEVSQAQNVFRSARNEVSELNAIINSYPGRIHSSLSRQENLRGEIRSLERDLSEENQRLNERLRDLRLYEPHREIRERLFSDFSYRRAQDAVRSLENQLRSQQSSVQSAQRDFDQASRALQECRNQERPVRNAPPVGGDPLPPTPPPVNCSTQESAYNSAQSRLNSEQSRLNGLASQLDQQRQHVSRIESDIRYQVETEHSRRQALVREVEREIDSIENNISSRQRELSSEMQSEAHLRQVLAQSRSRLPGAQTQLSQAQQNLEQAQQKYDQFARDIGFDVALANYQSAQNRLSLAQRDLAQHKKHIAQLEQQNKKTTALITTLGAQIVKLQPQRDKALADLNSAAAELAPFSEQLNKIESERKATEVLYLDHKRIYLEQRTTLLQMT